MHVNALARGLLRSTVRAAEQVGLFNAVESLYASSGRRVLVLTYHAIVDGEGFQQQMQYVARSCSVISMAELLQAHERGTNLPPRALLLTFDDALTNFESCAWPILKQHRLPATLFVPTAYPDDPALRFWWHQMEHALAHTSLRAPLRVAGMELSIDSAAEREHTYRRLRRHLKAIPHRQAMECVERVMQQLQVEPPPANVLGWDALRRLASEGVTLGAHTRTHPLLNRIPHDQAIAEASASLADLRREIGAIEPVFAYPAGGYTIQCARALREVGFKLAFTTERGLNDLDRTDPMLLRRNNVGVRANAAVLRARLLQARLLR